MKTMLNIKRFTFLIIISLISILNIGCTNDYAIGEKVGYITKLEQTGLIYNSYEITMNLSQTGNNSNEFYFSIDNDILEEEQLRLAIAVETALNYGYRVKLIYKQSYGLNWCSNRGDTDFFIQEVIPLEFEYTQDSVVTDTI